MTQIKQKTVDGKTWTLEKRKAPERFDFKWEYVIEPDGNPFGGVNMTDRKAKQRFEEYVEENAGKSRSGRVDPMEQMFGSYGGGGHSDGGGDDSPAWMF